MIDRLHLRNFKCFEDEDVNLGGITLLAGLNGTGKSSVIQALLVLRQSGVVGDDLPSEYGGWGVRWQGSLVDLGSFRDVLHEGASDDTVGLKVSFDSTSCVEVNVRGVSPEGHIAEGQGFHGESESSLYRWSMFYLGADRLGPQKALPFFDQEHGEGTPLGAKGEHVLWFLETRGGERVAETLCHPDEPTKTLAAQTNAWLKFISPGGGSEVDPDISDRPRFRRVHLCSAWRCVNQTISSYERRLWSELRASSGCILVGRKERRSGDYRKSRITSASWRANEAGRACRSGRCGRGASNPGNAQRPRAGWRTFSSARSDCWSR